MKRIISCILIIVMICTTAIADCNCVTDEVRIAMFDLISINDLKIEENQHDIIVSAYLGINEECNDLKMTLLNVITANYDLLNEKLSSDKYLTLISYITVCGCGCEEEQEEQTEPETTKKPTKPVNTKPAATATPKPHTHRYTMCYYANETYHRWKCSCGESKLKNHNWEVTYQCLDYKIMRCSDCKKEKTIQLPHVDNNGCSCGCSGSTCTCCEGCSCHCND